MDWDNQFLSKREIYNLLRKISGSYGSCMAVNKESAVHRCTDALMALSPSNVNVIVHCQECKHAYINSFSEKSGIVLCRLFTNRAGGEQISMQDDDFCSYGEKED